MVREQRAKDVNSSGNHIIQTGEGLIVTFICQISIFLFLIIIIMTDHRLKVIKNLYQ